MQFLILTNKGLENTGTKEIKNIINVEAVKKEKHLLFETKKREDAYKLAYMGRSFTRVLEIKNQNKNPFEIDYTLSFDKKKSVSLEIIREGNHDFNSADLFNVLKEKIISQGYAVKQKNSEIPLLLFVKDDEAYFCIDYSGFDLGKREYKIFINNNTIKGNIAAGILLMNEIEKGNLLDPFCRDGTFAIEAVLIAKNQSVHHYNKEKFSFIKTFDEDCHILEKFDKIKEIKNKIIAADKNFANISSAKKNAIIDGLRKEIRFLKCAIDDIDLKFEKEIDFIITMPVEAGRLISEKIVEKTAEQLFNRAKHALTENGKIILVLKKNTEIYKEKAKDFSLIEEKEIMQGKERIKIMVYSLC